MKFLFVNFKDLRHPHAGGAEQVNHSIMSRLVQEGHKVCLLTSSYPGANVESKQEGIKVIRKGSNRYWHNFEAAWYYYTHLRNKYDVVVEVVNTAPYFINLIKGKERYYVLYHQLCRDVWFYETGFPLNYLGYYILEPIANWLNSHGNTHALTVSRSTAMDLEKAGFKKELITVLPESVKMPGLNSLDESLPKEQDFTVLYFGSLRAMKRPIEVLKAFHELTQNFPLAKLWIAGGGSPRATNKLKKYVEDNNMRHCVKFYGRVSDNKKAELMQRAHVLCMTSAYEGWGLTITEAGKYGTPAVVYDRNGMRDAVINGETGYIVPDLDYQAMAEKLALLAVNPYTYEKRRKTAFRFAKQFTSDATFRRFRDIAC